jgi:site-specific DNA-methyltransferase (cytosine-N4-specific)
MDLDLKHPKEPSCTDTSGGRPEPDSFQPEQKPHAGSREQMRLYDPAFLEERPGDLLDQSNLYVGDALTVLKGIPDETYQCCVTSPPYWGLRDYGIPNQIGAEDRLDDYIANLVDVFREVRRVLANNGTLWLNIGDSFTSGGRTWRHSDRKNPARGMDYRAPTPEGLKSKDLIGVPWRLAFALQEDGWYLRSDIIWHKPNCQPESVKDRPTRSHEYVFLFSKAERYYYDWEAIKEPATSQSPMRNRRSVWSINTEPNPNAHFATFPTKLVSPCILAGTREGDRVLDPFFGSGTLGEVCLSLGRTFDGIELKEDYANIARSRLGWR